MLQVHIVLDIIIKDCNLQVQVQLQEIRPAGREEIQGKTTAVPLPLERIKNKIAFDLEVQLL